MSEEGKKSQKKVRKIKFIVCLKTNYNTIWKNFRTNEQNFREIKKLRN